jgi:hypothetical protein
MKHYKNRYGDIFKFSINKEKDILWKGNFEYCRFGMPNDYTKAYNAYINDVATPMVFEEFKEAVHNYNDETHTYDYPEYVKMVETLWNEIDMIDPSGGPYISVGMSMDSFGFKGEVIDKIVPIKGGYKLITKKCSCCGLKGGVHKLDCETRKITIIL